MGRLFWKLFSAFWLAYVVIIAAALWGTKLYHDYLEREYFDNSSRPETLTIARTLEQSGEEAAIRLIRELDGLRRLRIVVVDDEGQSLTKRPLPHRLQRAIQHARKTPLTFPQRTVKTPSGKSYHVISLGHRGPGHPRPFRNMPGILLAITSVVCLLMCFWLARYLSRPVKKLSSASRSFSEGDLDIRVAPDLGTRRDEIADLARDFDRMAEKLQALISGQQQLLQDVSHELRSPLARLQMAVGLSRKRRDGQNRDPMTETELERIEKDVKRLDELVGQVLTLSRMETDVADTRTSLVDVNALLETIVEDANFEARPRNREVILNSSIQPEIMADAELLRQALENIIRNAIKYTGEHTTVNVELSAASDGFLIRVCDRGQGVAENMLERLFDPFVRTSQARERDDGGYGLGLAIARRSVELHGGKITASNRDGGGLCIDIVIKSKV